MLLGEIDRNGDHAELEWSEAKSEGETVGVSFFYPPEVSCTRICALHWGRRRVETNARCLLPIGHPNKTSERALECIRPWVVIMRTVVVEITAFFQIFF